MVALMVKLSVQSPICSTVISPALLCVAQDGAIAINRHRTVDSVRRSIFSFGIIPLSFVELSFNACLEEKLCKVISNGNSAVKRASLLLALACAQLSDKLVKLTEKR